MMNKNKIVLGLFAAMLFQLIVLISMVLLSAMPLWTGNEIKIETIPVDPRSMFRGNYARLRYDISDVKVEHSIADKKIRNGEVVYVGLKKNENGLFEFSSASFVEPEQGVYLRGRIENHRYSATNAEHKVKYGIEAFFAPKEKALALEKDLRDGGVAVLMVSNSGKARLKDVIGNVE